MKKNITKLSESAALQALGALDPEEARSLKALLAADPKGQSALQEFGAVAEKLAQSLPRVHPSPDLKTRILAAAEKSKARARAAEAMRQMLPQAQNGLSFLANSAEAGWLPLPVSGAFVKLMSFDPESTYAVVLGKLEAGSRYPGHTHKHPEDIFMISGDLHVGDQVLRAGDFHHAEAGSTHPVNWSEQGCVLLCVLSKEDLLHQLG